MTKDLADHIEAERKENGEKLLDLCEQAQDAADAGNLDDYDELLERIRWVRKHLLF